MERHQGTALIGVRRVATAALEFLLPRACAACAGLMHDGDSGLVCGRCWSRVEPLPAPRCERCGHPRLRDACGWCELLPSYVRAVRSLCWMHRGTGADIVHALKYAGWHAIGDDIGQRMARLTWPVDVVEERAALVPVPLSTSRMRERGYNQSERIASAISARWRIPVWQDVLVRSRVTQTQTRLTPEERLANVSGAFHVPASAVQRLRNVHVVLVDDVVTTAATLNACAATLFAGGARIISYVTFGRAPAVGDR